MPDGTEPKRWRWELWRCRNCRMILEREGCTVRHGLLECGPCLIRYQIVDCLERYYPNEPEKESCPLPSA